MKSGKITIFCPLIRVSGYKLLGEGTQKLRRGTQIIFFDGMCGLRSETPPISKDFSPSKMTDLTAFSRYGFSPQKVTDIQTFCNFCKMGPSEGFLMKMGPISKDLL